MLCPLAVCVWATEPVTREAEEPWPLCWLELTLEAFPDLPCTRLLAYPTRMIDRGPFKLPLDAARAPLTPPPRGETCRLLTTPAASEALPPFYLSSPTATLDNPVIPFMLTLVLDDLKGYCLGEES